MNRRTLLLLLLVVAVLGAGGFYFYQQRNNSAGAAVAARTTATVSRGTLVATVSAAGNIYAPQQSNLNFQLTGVPITKVNVQVGDKVKAGDVLAQVDDSDLQFSLRTAQANLSSAKAKLEALKLPPSDADVAVAKAQIASAQAAYDAAVAKNARTGDQITVAKAALDKATITLQSAQAAYNAVSWRSDIAMLSQSTQLQQATIDYQSALANYNITLAGINDSAVKSAAQSLVQAQANLANLTAPPTAQDLAASQAAVEVSQVAVDQAKRKLDQAKIVAPFDGTVAAVNYVAGQLAVAGGGTTLPMITLVNLDNLQTQVNLAEVDIAKIKANQDVTLTFDALGRRSVPGKIVSVAPVGTITQGVVNYVVTVALTRHDATIKPGMTAEATIVVERRENVLLAPNRAVKTQGNQRLLTLLYEGKEVPLVVRTGLNNDQNTEIVSATGPDGQAFNLQDGDTIALNPTTSTSNRGIPGVGGPMIIGAPGR